MSAIQTGRQLLDEPNPVAPLVKQVAAEGRLPVVNFVAGGISTPADAALVMQLGAEGVFVGSGIFKAEDPARMANAIVQATTHFQDAKIIAEVSKGLGAPMRGIAMEAIPAAQRLAVPHRPPTPPCAARRGRAPPPPRAPRTLAAWPSGARPRRRSHGRRDQISSRQPP